MEQNVDVTMPLMRRKIVEAIQLVQVGRIKDRVADEMADIPVLSSHAVNRGSRAGGGEVGPTGTSATADCRICNGSCRLNHTGGVAAW